MTDETRALALVDVWRPRLLITERIAVEFMPDDGEGPSEKWARCYPVERETESFWSFILEVYDSCPDDELERVIVHELCHVLLERIRGRLFYGMTLEQLATPRQIAILEDWETVVDRLADAYLRAYAWYPSEAALNRAAARTGGREFGPPRA